MGCIIQSFLAPVHSFVKTARIHAALIATAFALASMVAVPATARAEDRIDDNASGPHNIVQLQNHNDGTLRVKGHVQLGRVPGPNVGPVNYAAAVNVCSSACDTLAVALQINLVNRNYTVLAPQNAAVAVNGGCDGCRAIAVAYQYNIGVDDPNEVPAGVNKLIVQMREELTHLDASGATLQQAIAEVNVVIGQYKDLAACLITTVDDQSRPARPAAQPSPAPATSAPEPSPTPEPSPGPATEPVASPSAEATPEPSPSPATEAVAGPSAEATPEPSPSP